MKKYQILLPNIFLILTTSSIPIFAFASAESENIWLYITLIPVYLILILQTLIVLLASLMKQFKMKKPVLISVIVASIAMLIGTVATCIYETLENTWLLLKYFIPIGAIVFILPVVQFKLLNKAEKNADEIDG
ncbi:MAG: hypothetical protein D8M62_12335 [Proteobacteria bacterium]|nr:hypothetical protein [Pseudomonadota bacterium]